MSSVFPLQANAIQPSFRSLLRKCPHNLPIENRKISLMGEAGPVRLLSWLKERKVKGRNHEWGLQMSKFMECC